jgi:hypothetical protein
MAAKKTAKPDEIETKIDSQDELPEVIVASEPDQRVMEPEEGLEALKAQLESERNLRREAEQRAQMAAQDAYKAKERAQDTDLSLVSNAISTVKSNMQTLRQNYILAVQNGDAEAQADIQLAMADASSKLMELEKGKEALERAPKPQFQQYQAPDPVETIANQIAQQGYSRSAEWIRKHPEFVTNPKLYKRMLAAHELAISEDITPDTDEYFDAIEGTLRLARIPVAPTESPTAQAAQVTQRRASPPAAPVTRAGNGTGQRQTTYTLSQEEADMAEMMGMTHEEYAANKIALRREGRMH